MVKVNRTPLKRFGEFNSQWQTEKLDYLVTWASGGTPSKSVDAYWNGEIPWISASSMRGLEYSDSEIKITAEGLVNGSKLARKGNLLLLVRGSMLFNKIPIGIVACDVSFNQDVKSLACKADIIPRFLLYWFYASEHKLLNMVVGTGIGAGKLDLQDLKLMDVVFPSLPEQQKIASFLTAVDDKIQQLSKKKTLLEQYKKGLMQQLFSQQIRFKDDQGNEYSDWEEKKLGEICHKKSSNISANSLEENNGEYTIYGATGFLKRVDFYREEAAYISIVKDGAGVGRVLMCAPKTSVLGTLDIVINNTGVDLYFLYLSLQNIEFTKYITGSTIPHIYFRDYSKEFIEVPSLEEQTKIANFLSAIDNKINLVNRQLKQTRQYKKGLLQQMFV